MKAALRVLYAEDNDQDADLTRTHFSEHAPDFEFEVVTSGRACLDRMSVSPPDLLLLDQYLPDMEGLDVLRSVVRTGVAVPVVLVTAVGDEQLVVKALRSGASTYVPKAGRYLETLPDVLRTAIEKHRLGLDEGLHDNERHRILYVEHDASDIDLTLRHLAEVAPHFDVAVARTCHDALARLSETPGFDAAVIDLRMPEQSGLDLVRDAWDRRLRLPPFVMITGRGDEAAAVASLKLGAVDYIAKHRGYLDKLASVLDRAIAHDRLVRLTERLQVELADRRRAEEALREANARLGDADQRKNEFIAILSHELRNPLAPLRYALPLLRREDLPDSATRALSVINRQVGHLARLVDDLLDVSRITRGLIELRPEHITLGSVVTAAVDAVSATFAAARHTLDVELPDDPIWLHADPARIEQVVVNLLNNSAKYTPRGGRIVLRAGCEQGQAVIRVRDTGIGIPADALPSVFEMFHQVRNRPDESKGGLGIGLALVRRLVEMHGGSVEASSEGAGQGAEFVVRLPVVAGTTALQNPHEAPAQAVGRRLKVLIVDDNADLVEMLATTVTDLGHDVRKALDGSTAVAAALAYQPDVVLLDLGLPVMNGLEVARELRRQPHTAGARLVALTGWGQAEDRRQTREAGFDQHLTKPTEPKRLAELLAQFAAKTA